MPIKFRCPKCNKPYSAKDEHAGKTAKCQCGHRIRIPDAANPTATEPAITQQASPSRTQDPQQRPGPTSEKPKEGDVGATRIASTSGLTSSFFESWGVYFAHIGSVWGFTFTVSFRAIGALFSGKLLQVALAVTDFFVKLKAKDGSPDQNSDRLFSLSNEQIGIDKKKNRKEMSKVMSPAILALMLGPIAAVVGAIKFGLLGFLIPVLVAALVYFRSIAILVLNAGFFIKFGPGDITAHDAETTSIRKRYALPFALYCLIAAIASYVGIIFCCVGIFLTIPYMVVAMYIGMINTLGIQASDIDRFLVSEDVHPK